MSFRFLNICAALGIVALVVYVLIIGRDFLVPFVCAVAVWYLMIALKDSYKRLGRWTIPIPDGIALALAVLTTVLGIWMIVVLFNSSINGVIAAAPRYEERFKWLVEQGALWFGVTEKASFEEVLSKIQPSQIISQIAGAFVGLAGDVGLIIIYVLFLLLETRAFSAKMNAVARTPTQRAQLRQAFGEIAEDINAYMRIKTWLSAFIGLVGYVIMKAAGIDFAEFWAVLIFLFNYIPTFGAPLGVIFPALMMLVQFDSAWFIGVVIGLLLIIPVAINNVIEPRLMGRSLNLSSLVIIMSLVLWGSIWGIIGMFLCMPIMVMMNIILAKFPATRPVAVFMSATGRIDIDRQRDKVE